MSNNNQNQQTGDDESGHHQASSSGKKKVRRGRNKQGPQKGATQVAKTSQVKQGEFGGSGGRSKGGGHAKNQKKQAKASNQRPSSAGSGRGVNTSTPEERAVATQYNQREQEQNKQQARVFVDTHHSSMRTVEELEYGGADHGNPLSPRSNYTDMSMNSNVSHIFSNESTGNEGPRVERGDTVHEDSESDSEEKKVENPCDAFAFEPTKRHAKGLPGQNSSYLQEGDLSSIQVDSLERTQLFSSDSTDLNVRNHFGIDAFGPKRKLAPTVLPHGVGNLSWHLPTSLADKCAVIESGWTGGDSDQDPFVQALPSLRKAFNDKATIIEYPNLPSWIRNQVEPMINEHLFAAAKAAVPRTWAERFGLEGCVPCGLSHDERCVSWVDANKQHLVMKFVSLGFNRSRDTKYRERDGRADQTMAQNLVFCADHMEGHYLASFEFRYLKDEVTGLWETPQPVHYGGGFATADMWKDLSLFIIPHQFDMTVFTAAGSRLMDCAVGLQDSKGANNGAYSILVEAALVRGKNIDANNLQVTYGTRFFLATLYVHVRMDKGCMIIRGESDRSSWKYLLEGRPHNV